MHVTIGIYLKFELSIKKNKCTKLTVNEAVFFLIANVISIKDLLKYIRLMSFISSLILNLMHNITRDFMPIENCLFDIGGVTFGGMFQTMVVHSLHNHSSKSVSN